MIPKKPDVSRLQRKKILIVDDDASIREILATHMGRLNFDTVTAGDGREAIALFKSEKPDLIIMDVMMPVMDGLAATKAIRALEKESRTPILFLTARDAAQDKLISALSGGDDFVSKPISLQELHERIDAALAKKK